MKNKTILITGGASGIGLAMTTRFAEEGANVFFIDYDQKAGEKAANDLIAKGLTVTFLQGDVSKTSEMQDTIASIPGNIDVLVNNAGISHIGNLENTGEDDFDRLYQVNVKGIYNCSLGTLPKMKENGGSIINMASIASTMGLPDRFAYSMTKGAVFAMTLSMARDYVEYNIRVNSIAPGRVHTPFVDGFLAKNYPGKEKEMFDKLAATQPIGRMGKPEEIAAMALYLSSDEASFLTGGNYPIDGGFVSLKM
ncbi:short-chain dehydrogenase [Echinicola strongylocentroti]|uniref:Short-chain dehydrogenase n=1 Tax=Echinicola strongylocentroti TaxID=1795355 RepID=A0A2Z4IN06_9BACT|nr:SDR family oxidoreductase [Echinicola strongylocentroti]AWW32491.1 short-chain dehydrogenase [Echinicola strongylocentroti]